MPKYKVMEEYKRWDDTVIPGTEECVEYPISGTLYYLKTARDFLKCHANKNKMRILEHGLKAESYEETIDPETGYITKEIKRLRIEMYV